MDNIVIIPPLSDPPRLFGGATELTGQKGSSVTLQFSVSGSPIPSVIWEHEGHGEVKMSSRQHVVELSGGVTSLTISDLICEDDGIYTCTAVNHLGTVSTACRLTVLGKHHIKSYVQPRYSGVQDLCNTKAMKITVQNDCGSAVKPLNVDSLKCKIQDTSYCSAVL